MKVENQSVTLRGWDAVRLGRSGALLGRHSAPDVASDRLAGKSPVRGSLDPCGVRRRPIQILAVRDGVRDRLLRQDKAHVPNTIKGKI